MPGAQFVPTPEDMAELQRQYPHNILREYLGHLETSPGRAIKARLLADPRVQALNGQKLSSGSGWGVFQDFHLLCWYLWYMDQTDTTRADQALNAYLDLPEIEVLITRWVLGVEVDAPLALPGDVSLVPPSVLPRSVESEYLRRSKIGFPPFQTVLPQAALVKRVRIPKIFVPGASALARDTISHAASALLSNVAFMLNAIDGICIQPHVATTYRDPSVPFGPFGGHGSSRSHFDVTATDTVRVGSIDADLLGRLLAAHLRLPDAKRRRIDLILSRLGQAKRRVDLADKILDLGVTLEMLLLSESTGKEQLSMAFRLRGSWLLGQDAADRGRYFESFKELYDLRSKVAHTGSLGPKQSEVTRVAVRAFETLACQVFQTLLLRGEPDWKRMLLGESGW